MDIIQIFSAAGFGGIVGSLLTTAIQLWFSRKSSLEDRGFQEKKQAYVGYLEAGYVSEIQKTEASVNTWAYWDSRCALVGSPAVLELLVEMKRTNPVDNKIHPDRLKIYDQLMKAMRTDLGVDIKN